MNNNSKNILIINDMPGYSKVAMAAMLPILSHMGHSVYNLPTALVSNTLDYGKFALLDTTDYMTRVIEVWIWAARPKSKTLIFLSEFIIMLPGLISRCITFISCA